MRRVLASFLWLGSASLVAQAVSWVSTVLVIRLLSPDDYGLMAMAMLAIGFLMLIGDLGVGAVVVQAPTLDREHLRALFGACLLTYLVGAVVVYSAAPLVAAFFAEPRLITLLRTLSLCFVFAGFYAVPQSLVARTLRFDRKAKVEALTAVVASGAAVTLALTGWGVWALVGAVLVSHAFRAVAFQVLRPCLFLPFPSLAQLRGSVHFGGWVTLDRMLWFGYTNLDVAIAGRVLGGALVGVYSVALSLASIPLDKVMSVVTEVSFSAFSRVQEDRELFRRSALRALESVSLLAFPAFLGMAVVAPEIFEVFLGPRWVVAVLPFQILCLVFPFRAVGLLFAPVLFGSGRPRVVVENNAITLGCVGIAMVIGVHWGVIGLAVGWVVGYLPAFFLVAHRTLAVLEIPVRQAVSAMGFPIAAALTMAAAVAMARPLVDDELASLGVLASLVLLGAGVYGVLLVTFRRRVLRAFWALSLGK